MLMVRRLISIVSLVECMLSDRFSICVGIVVRFLSLFDIGLVLNSVWNWLMMISVLMLVSMLWIMVGEIEWK